MITYNSPLSIWKSPISAADVTLEGQGHSFSDLSVDQVDEYQGNEVFWTELRAQENGRSVLCSYCMKTKTRKQWTPADYSVCTSVHEYGGGAVIIVRGVVYFSNMSDQRIYRQTSCDAPPEALTAESQCRYADGFYSSVHDRLFYVREDHSPESLDKENAPTATIVQINPNNGETVIVTSGSDFYSSPRVSRDGSHLAWIEWSHPYMPWDQTRLMVCQLNSHGMLDGEPRLITKSSDDRPLSLLHPVWTKDGGLLYAGDHEGFWNLYHIDANGGNRHLVFTRGGSRDVVEPPWVFNYTCFWYSVENDSVAVNVVDEGMMVINLSDGSQRTICSEGGRASLVRGSSAGRLFVVTDDFKSFPTLLAIDYDKSAVVLEIAQSIDYSCDPMSISVPRHIEFATTDNGKAFAYYYPPRNSGMRPNGALPPLIVEAHGGPTSSASTHLRLAVQYWTTRGFALVDVNYRGSSGYGRRYREALLGKWGIYDVDDCCAAVQYLVRENLVDRDRICIRGGSAGGFTTLACLACRDVFTVGASYYGVSDLELLMADTHKFESHYLETLIGPWPLSKSLFQHRSPINSLDRFSSPVVFFQGEDDAVVPPEQAQSMFKALNDKGITTALMMFPGERHGFKKKENVVNALKAELFFFAQVLNLGRPDGDSEELETGGLRIENLFTRTRRLTS